VAYTWAYKGEVGYGIDRVIALRDIIYNNYNCGGIRPDRGANHKEMLENGWEFSSQGHVVIPLTASAGILGSFTDSDDALDIYDFAQGNCEIFAAEWPAEEDHSRLSKDIERMKKKELQREESRARMELARRKVTT
jgi:hypothetical protein